MITALLKDCFMGYAGCGDGTPDGDGERVKRA